MRARRCSDRCTFHRAVGQGGQKGLGRVSVSLPKRSFPQLWLQTFNTRLQHVLVAVTAGPGAVATAPPGELACEGCAFFAGIRCAAQRFARHRPVPKRHSSLVENRKAAAAWLRLHGPGAAACTCRHGAAAAAAITWSMVWRKTVVLRFLFTSPPFRVCVYVTKIPARFWQVQHHALLAGLLSRWRHCCRRQLPPPTVNATCTHRPCLCMHAECS
jgi:hypothetical protein